MSDRIDPYRQWLEIASEKLPPDHYALLGLAPFESDADAISAAANRATEAVRNQATEAQAALAARLLEEIAQAHRCLTNTPRKAAYDRMLKQKAGSRSSTAKTPPPLPKPRMLKLPPFTPPSPPLQPGAPPVPGEPAPPPVMGEPVHDPPPALHPSKLPGDLPDPPPRLPAPAPSLPEVVDVSARRRKFPTIGPPPGAAQSTPMLGQPVDSPPPVLGQPVDSPPPVPGQPVGSPPPAPVDVAPARAPDGNRGLALPNRAQEPSGDSALESQATRNATSQPALAPPPAADRQREQRDAAPLAPAEPPPRELEPGVDPPQPRRRSVPLPRKTTEALATSSADAPAPDQARHATPGDKAAVASPVLPAADAAWESSEPATGPAEPEPRTQTPGAGKRQGLVGTAQPPDDRERLPWPILIPSAAAILILIVGSAVLLGGFGTGGRQAARKGSPGGDPADTTPAEEAVDVALLRDDEGSIATPPKAGDESSAGEGSEAESAEDGAATESDTDTGAVVPPADRSDAAGAASDGGPTAENAEAISATAGDPTESEPSESEAAAPAEPATAPESPRQNPFRALPQQIDLTAATAQALAAAKQHPLDAEADRISLGTIDLAGETSLSLKLVGGEPALPGAGEFALKREFSLEDPHRWRIDLVEGPDVALPLGTLALTGNDLSFRWTDNHDVSAAAYLQNCVLQLESDQYHHVLGLRQPLPAPPVLLEMHLNEFQESIPVPALPEPEVVRLEIVRLTGTRQATGMPADPSARPGQSVVVNLLDSHRNAPAAIRVTCEDARAGRVRFRVTPMGKTAGRAWATMGIQSATSEIGKLRKEKDGLHARLKVIDQQIRAIGGQNRDLVRALGESKKAILTRIRSIDQRVGQLNAVVARLKPLHQTAGIQFRVVAMLDGQDVVLAGPPIGK